MKRAAIIVIVCLCLAWITTLAYFKLTKEYKGASIIEIVSSQADNPFQYRLMTPLAIIGLFKITGLGFIKAQYYFYLAAFFFLYLFFYRYLRELYRPNMAMIGIFLLFLSLIAMMVHNLHLKTAGSLALICFRFSWDVTALIFTIGLCTCIVKRKLAYWYVFFTLGAFNRETCLLLLPALFIASWGGLGPIRAILHTGLSFGIWVGIKAFLSYLYPGAMTFNKLYENINYLKGNIPYVDLWTMALVFGGLWILIPLGLCRLPKGYTALLTAIPATLFVMFFAGNLWEVRVYNELAIIVIPTILMTFQDN